MMVMDIGDPEQFIKQNELKEVTSNNIFIKKSSLPDPEGLGSYEIFGDIGTEDRKKTFAYINLNDTFIHPIVFEVLKLLKKSIVDCVYGYDDFYVEKGELLKVSDKNIPPHGTDVGNGFNWFKKHFREINFEKEEMSNTVEERVFLIKNLSLNEIFITKFLVNPPYYREIDMSGGKKNDINVFYQKLLSQAGVVRTTRALFGTSAVTDAHRKIQDILNEMYVYFTTFIGGSKAFMHQSGIGKAIDYSARMVISCAKLNSNDLKDMEVDFAHSAVPLFVVLEIFKPFIIYGFRKFIQDKINGSNFLFTIDPMGKLKRIELAPHWQEMLLEDNISKLINLYTDSKEHRLDTLTVEGADGNQYPLGYIEGDQVTTAPSGALGNINARPLTLCEVFYMIVMDGAVKDKNVLITRYPIEDYHNIYPSLMNIIPFYKYEKRTINGKVYPRYPIITPEDITDYRNIGKKFDDTLRLFPTYLSSLGGDFDGDTCSLNSVYTKNSGCNEFIYSKLNIINTSGESCRPFSEALYHALYNLTKN